MIGVRCISEGHCKSTDWEVIPKAQRKHVMFACWCKTQRSWTKQDFIGGKEHLFWKRLYDAPCPYSRHHRNGPRSFQCSHLSKYLNVLLCRSWQTSKGTRVWWPRKASHAQLRRWWDHAHVPCCSHCFSPVWSLSTLLYTETAVCCILRKAITMPNCSVTKSDQIW